MNLRTLVSMALLLGGCGARGCADDSTRAASAARRSAPTPASTSTSSSTEIHGDPVATVGQTLLDFESMVQWPDASPSLPGGHEAWVTAVRQARTPEALAATVVQFEGALGDEGMAEGWSTRRDEWARSLQAPTPAVLARAVRTLGDAVRESRLQTGWSDKRGPWRERLDAVR